MAIENRNVCSLSDDEKENLLLLHQAELAEGLNKSIQNYRKITQAGIAQWVRDFKDGHIKLSTVDDLKKLVELEIYLLKHEEI
ncbi:MULTISPECIES: hypothetical protein [Bacillus subtilis group]|nr:MULTISPECIES: hypothetical protein [Bacillus subtilis group]MBG9768854.1 hypothetical protein [Bacillus vallismortis]MCY8420281.1 hypothetical protein [Bacillus inaquosorum]MCY9175145.1 hypothetical protein [Bacillus inaquosorum]MEC0978994.1 hypothetical protein [Bacillus inaquosorum]MEC1665520.1 hypothetical protein [Bacillus halotolerans]